MAGLSLSTGIRAGANYSPMTPAAASPPTARSTIAQAAYGVNGTGADYGPRTAGYGSVGVGMVSMRYSSSSGGRFPVRRVGNVQRF